MANKRLYRFEIATEAGNYIAGQREAWSKLSLIDQLREHYTKQWGRKVTRKSITVERVQWPNHRSMNLNP